MKALLAALAVLILGGPAGAMLAIGLFVTPAAASCGDRTLSVGDIPDSLTATTASGASVSLDHTQLTHAATIITVAGRTQGAGRPAALIALMAALTESSLRMLANTSAYPDSAGYPNDGDGSDHDSLGLFQMRPQAGWGSVAELMDPGYQARAFYGGPTGPNYPSPRGLLDIPDWQQLDPGQAAQAVEVSAYPDRYQNYQPVAETIIDTLTRPSAAAPGDATIPESSRIVIPLPDGTWTISDTYGWRSDPFTGQREFHTGTDLAAAAGTPILAAADGIVVKAGSDGDFGNLVVVESTVDGAGVATGYAHIRDGGIHVIVGQRVQAGQEIAEVGMTGRATGPHLHFQVEPGHWGGDTVDSWAWLQDHHAESLSDAQGVGQTCS